MNPAQKKSVVKKCNDVGIMGNTPEAIAKNVDSMSEKTAKETMENIHAKETMVESIHAKEDKTSAETVSMMSIIMKIPFKEQVVISIIHYIVCQILDYIQLSVLTSINNTFRN